MARQLGISPKLPPRWQQAQLVAEVGSAEVARDPEVRALRARLNRAEQELDILKKSRGHLRPADPVSASQHLAQRTGQVPVRQLCQVLRVAPCAYYAWHRQRDQAVPEPAWQVAVREAFAHHSPRPR